MPQSNVPRRPSLAAILTALMVGTALAGPEKIEFPDNYAATFVRYATVDKPDREPPIVRFMYINAAPLAAAQPNEPLPHGAVLVMEDHEAKLADNGEPARDANGRFVPTDEITNVFVQQKERGWGAKYPEAKRNGEWEYAWFRPDGIRRDRSMDSCFECHRKVADQDFTFTAWPFITRIKGD